MFLPQNCILRVQNEQFSEDKGFIILRYRPTEKEVYSAGMRTPNIHGLRSERTIYHLH